MTPPPVLRAATGTARAARRPKFERLALMAAKLLALDVLRKLRDAGVDSRSSTCPSSTTPATLEYVAEKVIAGRVSSKTFLTPRGNR